jgi:hypothetical protein
MRNNKKEMPDLLTQLNDQKRKVDFDSYDITVKELVGMVGDNMIDIAPEYQRRFRWDDKRQSALIESVFLGIPVPALFMAANPDGTWELIDGVQRLCTLIHFVGDEGQRKKIGVDEPLRLTEITKLSHFDGKAFADLPGPIQLQFRLKPLKITTISDKSDNAVRFDLFERLNTGGVLLTPQEIRACLYRGEFNELLRELARDPNFRKVVLLREDQKNNGTREEFVLRFFAYTYAYQDFEHIVKDFLNAYMERSSKSFQYAEGQKLFKRVFRELALVLPDGITRGRANTPVNLFEAVVTGAALALQMAGVLVTTGIGQWLRSKELARYTTVGTNNKALVQKRIEFCRDKFLGK